MEPVLLEPEDEDILQQGYTCFIGVILIIGKLFDLRKSSGRNIGLNERFLFSNYMICPKQLSHLQRNKL